MINLIKIEHINDEYVNYINDSIVHLTLKKHKYIERFINNSIYCIRFKIKKNE